MSSKRMLVVTMALLVSLIASFGSAADTKPKAKKSETSKTTTEAKAPRLTIVQPVKDYGTIPKGEKLEWSFEIKNTGNADLLILAAKPGCGCTVADFDKVIKPGQTGKVTAHVDTTNFSGPIAKPVTLETNDPNTPTAQLTINAIVKPYVEAHPTGFVRFQLLQGETETQSVTLYSDEEEPFEIKEVQVPPDENYIKVTTNKIENEADRVPGIGSPGQNQYKVNVTVGGPDVKLGPLADKVRIITNSKHQPEYSISVTGVIRPTFRVEPSALNFGEVTPTEAAATRSVILHSNDLKTPDRFMVTKAESNMPAITTAIKPGAQKGDYEVTLQVAPNAKPGDIDGSVTIYTSDKMNPVVTVPVKGTIKPTA